MFKAAGLRMYAGMKRKKRKGRGMHKGSKFERDICTLLSKWWTKDKRDDVFWRTSGSGARATQRGKKGTFGQYGDVQATDPIGQPLLNCCTIEIKRGYSKETFANMIETSTQIRAKPPLFYTFICQAQHEAKQAGTKYWLLITKRDWRAAIITLPIALYKKLIEINQMKGYYHLNNFRKVHVNWLEEGKKTRVVRVVILCLSDFLNLFNPDKFKQL